MCRRGAVENGLNQSHGIVHPSGKSILLSGTIGEMKMRDEKWFRCCAPEFLE